MSEDCIGNRVVGGWMDEEWMEDGRMGMDRVVGDVDGDGEGYGEGVREADGDRKGDGDECAC